VERAAAIELRQVSKRFGGGVALDNLSFAVPRGTAYGFLGP
jgi:ABC-type multidrug transport system ATPase subunit